MRSALVAFVGTETEAAERISLRSTTLRAFLEEGEQEGVRGGEEESSAQFGVHASERRGSRC